MRTMQRCVVGLVTVMAGLLLPAAGLAQTAAGATPAAVQVQVDRSGSALSLSGQPAFYTTRNDIRNQRMIAVPDSKVLLILWDEVTSAGSTLPAYGISLDGQKVARAGQTSYVLKLRHGEFDPAVGGPAPEAGLAAGAGCNLYIVQFVTQPLTEFRSQIDGIGGKIRHFLLNHAYVVEMSPGVRAAVAALPYVRWIGPYHPAYRLEEVLRNLPEPGKGVPAVQRYNIQVAEAGLSQKQAVANRIRGFGGYVDNVDFGKYLLVATLTREQLYQVATWNEVLFIDRWSPLERDMNNVRVLGGANYVESVAGFTGLGVRGEVFDAGFNLQHVDFQSRPLIQHGAVGSDSHGAATSGIVFGDGTGNANARGLLPSGQGIVGDYNTIGLSGPGRYTHTAEQVQAPYFCVFETASVGSSQVTAYTTISADTDAMLFDFDIVHCQSQSNLGNQSSRPEAWAKNIISGGGIYHYDNQDWTDDRWNGGASIGPAADGRIKPDLCAAYDAILTCSTGSPTAYQSGFGGTSGATPIIAGHTGLFFQMWSQGIFGNTVDPQGSVFDNRCHMTTAKAMMINNARSYPFSGTTGDLTRTHQGWGWPNAQRIYDLREKTFIIDETELLTNLQTKTFVLAVSPSEPEFRATLVYADPPGNPAAGHARINDLTLKVTSPSATVYWGNNGLLAGNYSTPGGSPNTVDTVENVFVQNPDLGAWIVEVIASEIVQDSHLETPGMDADFALVVSGVTPCSSRGSITLDRAVYMCSATATLRVVDCDLNTDPNLPDTVMVTIASDSEPAGESVLLTESAANTAVFVGTIALSTINAPGVLQVANGDTVTATYIDADDGMGGYNVVVTDTAAVDCVPPSVSNVHATDIQPRSAKVTFNANEPVRATVHYGLSCGALTGTASTATYDLIPVVSLSNLTDNTTYYYAVEAEDQAGNVVTDNNGGACYSFTTPEVPDYFTQLFSGDNDLDNVTLSFTPNASVDFYRGCAEAITALPTDPTGGTTLSFSNGDDGYAQVTPAATVVLYGVNYTTFYVGTNGYITFSTSDTTYTETLAAHFNQPRISALFDDLNPGLAGTVSWKQTADRVAVTWLNVTEYGASNQNTFQIEMFFDGKIVISYLAIAITDGLAGLSRGTGVPADFLMSDLSALGPCQGTPPTASNASVNTGLNTPVTITLQAIDDGQPNPPGALTYIITALPPHGSLSDPGAGAITAVPYTLVGGGRNVLYWPHTNYVGADSFQFKANDGGTPPEGGDSNIATISITVVLLPQQVYYFPLNTSPGWSTQGQWAFGQPLGGGTHNKDPNSGHSGQNVYGYNLAGDYANGMLVAYYLTTTAIDCQNVSGVELRFWRWLGVESSTFDHADLAVSNNGTSWTTVWSNPSTGPISDSAWTPQTFNIAAVADHQATVYIRWGMGPTDGGVSYPGWNIDDIEIWGLVPPTWQKGDTNCDGMVTFADINPFVLALGGQAGYEAQYPDCVWLNADCNDDLTVNFADINPFVAILSE